jgi:hypothetical protein
MCPVKIVIIGIICILALILYFGQQSEGFFQYLGYPPFAGPGYFFNFPSRQYPPLTYEGYDLRGPPGCPNFGPCGNAIRRGQRPYYYNYWWPLPYFDYSHVYGANGKLRDLTN